MGQDRIDKIKQQLQTLANEFVPNSNEPELTMFGLISRYNSTGNNTELVDGEWVRENMPNLSELP